MVLTQLSFSLQRGEVVALVGKNGAGKSTVATLLTGLYAPSEGTIQVSYRSDDENNNNNIKTDSATTTNLTELNRSTQAKLVQVVPQEPALFNMSVLDNVRYSRPDASREEAIRAMKSAHCGFALSGDNDKDSNGAEYDKGLQYVVGRNGARLSGGQRQRIGLARAFLADPVFLILDEPNASMDNEGETALNDALQACRSANRGLLIITHRAKTLEIADRVLVLKQGRVVEEGTLNELLQKGSSGELVTLMPDLE